MFIQETSLLFLPLYPKQAPPHKGDSAQHLPQHHRACKGHDESKRVDKPQGQCSALDHRQALVQTVMCTM